ncbi:putative nipped-b-like protein (delangin) (scc2 homolog) [Schistosoma mansoni]|uniref:putative nipped-b-like protein (delangin) (scc2 homolog) n=1 Tax=Schistosoma mansoni TaxID=6183 RepID=UPI00022DC9B9|nr:putative nipped-b-like protein (delangin) (scc2 homolog) [Schistosoma mansoni]|eukprot:XP_018654847.1 putative nipped-b-like protein (delangin) (scc2 homolog) [Schistosoma mansoni]
MNGDISRIPIQSLSAVVSLTDIIPELPLPAPLHAGSSVETLLHDSRISIDAFQCLRFGHDRLVGCLSEALGSVCTDNIDFKEGFASDIIDPHLLPEPLVSSLKKLPNFEQKRGFCGLSYESFNPVNSVSSAYKVQPGSWCSSLDQPPSTEHHHYSNSLEEPIESPSKKKKKRKKKKHKYCDDGDTSGTGGESNATTPAAYGGTTPNKLEDNSLSPTSTYGIVKVNADTKKLSLKIFKRPANDGSQPVFMVEQLGGVEPVKKEKKKKRNREKDREHRSHHEVRSKLDSHSSPVEIHVQQNELSIDLPIQTRNTPSNSPLSTVTPNENCKGSELIPSTFTESCQLSMKDPSQLDLSLIASEGLFENLNSMNNLYQQPQSVSTSSLPSTPASMSGNGMVVTSSNCAPTCTYSFDTNQTNVFTTKSNMFYELLRGNDPNMTLKHVADGLPSDFVASNSSACTVVPNTLGSVCNMMDFASNFLQNEMLSSNSCINFPLGTASLATCDSSTVQRTGFPVQPSSTTTSFLVASHLIDSSHSSVVTAADSTFDVLGGILNSSGYASVTDVSPAAFAANFDMSGLPPDSSTHHVPMGLASYLSAPNQITNTQILNDYRTQNQPARTDSNLLSTITSTPQPWWKRKSNSVLRRRKRRKNELEDLQSWTVNYPVSGPGLSKSASERTKGPDERTWDDAIGSYSQVLGERVKRRKRMVRQGGNFDSDFHVSRIYVKQENLRVNDVNAEQSVGGETGSVKRFLNKLSTVLESIEETDFLRSLGGVPNSDDQLRKSNCEDVISYLDKESLSTETIISSEDLAEFCRDAAKLNSIGVANQIPTGQLLNFLTLLLLNIRDGANVIAVLRPEEEADAHESKLWKEVAMERVMRSMNSGLTALLLMTSKDMPREVYVEDVIERTVYSVRFQLFNCIFPEFDPAYRVENTAKENQSSIKSRRARERDAQKPKSIIHLYHKLVEIVSNLSKLVKIQRLTDSLVLTLSSVGVSVFFVENVSELQLAALELVTAIFAQYETHRKLIMEEILASLSRLPSSKKNLRSYRLNSEDSIQMLTALALLLVQSVISLPDPSPLNSEQNTNVFYQSSNVSVSTDGGLVQKADDEVTIINSYHNALRTAHTFLLVFLRKSTMKGEDDYRIIFENFVNDLLLAVNKPEWPASEVMLSLLGSLLVQQFNNKALDQSVRVASVDYLGTVASTLRRDAVTSQLKEHDIDAVIRDLLDGNQSDEDEEDSEEELQDLDTKTDDTKEINGDRESSSEVDRNKSESDIHSVGSASTTETPIRHNENGYSSTNTKSVAKVIDTKIPKDKVIKSKRSGHKDKYTDPISQLDRVQALRDAILDYLAAEEASPTAVYARKFYLAQWLNDCTKETERAQRSAVQKKNQNAVLNGNGETVCATKGFSEADQALILAVAERRRQHILSKVREAPQSWRQRRCLWSNSLPSNEKTKQSANICISDSNQETTLIFQGTLDYEDCCLVCRYLASLRPFSQSFDVYLSQICRLLSESSVAVRTKALRCLSAVVEADPNVLARVDIERAVHSRLLDTSTSVREAAVDLLGRFLSCRPELTAQYYPMLAERIRDKGVSVRKRVIRILRDICLEQPDFPRVAEICVKMIRRVNDEEGIKKLVHEVFQAMWFTPVRERETVKLLRKVMNITDVVGACKDTGYEWFEQFLRTLLKKEETEKVKPVEKACKQIADCLVQNIMRLEEISSQSNQRLVACLATLHLLTKIRPELMVQYTMVLQPYLSIRCNEASDAHVLHYVARILEATLPLMEHPSETLVAQLEEDMVRLTLRHGKMVLESCVACLGAVVNRVSKNYSLARDCFTRFFNALQKFRNELSDDSERKISPTIRPSILRALFTVGLLCKHFDADVFRSSKNANIRDQVFETLMFFTEQVKSDIEMRKKALSGLGFLCTRHHELLCGPRLCKFYHDLLQAPCDEAKPKPSDHHLELKCIVLENLLNFFLEEEKRMLEADAKWKASQHQESLKEMGDIASGMGSSVAQMYLKDILESFFSPFFTVRLTALSVITTILRQGLVHPVQTVPYLIAMQSDIDPNIRIKADAQLQEIDTKFPGFLTMRAAQGVNLSYRLQLVLYNELREKLKGNSEGEVPSAMNSHLYSMLRNNKSQRRSLLNGLISLFDDSQKIPLSQLVYVADNLAHFPYQSQEEPLFVVHHIDLMVSMAGSGVLKNVREALFPELKAALEAVVAAQLETDAKNRAQMELQLSAELQAQQVASADAMSRGDHETAGLLADQIQHTIQRINSLNSSNPSIMSSNASLSEFPSGALIGTEGVSRVDLGPFEIEEEEDPIALFDRLSKTRQTSLAIVRDAMRTSRACVLLLTLKQFLKESYCITDGKIQRYSPSDSAKLWEKPLTRRVGVHFHPIPCLKAAGMEINKSDSHILCNSQSSVRTDNSSVELSNPNDKQADSGEEMINEMQSLIRDYLDFRKLILTIDPPGEEELGPDDLNTSVQSGGPTNDDRLNTVSDSTQLSKGRSVRTLVPQLHSKSSEDDNDSEDSNAGGASRLMLAQSAPTKKRKPALNLRGNLKNPLARNTKNKRKRRKRCIMAASSSGEESDSADESEPSDPDY